MTEKRRILLYINVVLILFVVSISYYGSQTLQLGNFNVWGATVARYVAYLLLMKGSHEACLLAYELARTGRVPWARVRTCRTYCVLLAASVALLLKMEQQLLHEDFVQLFIAYLITQYPELEQQGKTISYGTGMACSYYEGYLQNVIPSDGAEHGGLDDMIEKYQNKHGVVIPARRLFIVITRSLYSPPSLKEFNKPNRNDLSYLEPRQSMEAVVKSVAGVLNRTYFSSVYKVCRRRAPPASLVVECATPLHTLHRVLAKRSVFAHVANIDTEEVVNDFCGTLQALLDQSPECRGKCELVYFDDKDENQNLADVLIDRLRLLDPNFENIKLQ